MSKNDELELVIDEIEEPTSKKKVKKEKKPRKPMSAEHKAKLLLSLAKAREQSCLKRGLKSQAKKILKAQDEAETNEIIRKSLLAKDVEDPRDVQIKELRARLDGLTLQDVVKKPKTKPKVIIEESELESEAVTPSPKSDKPVPVPTPQIVVPIVEPIVEVVEVVPEPIIKKVKFKSLRGSKMNRY
tara:strand:+ start:143 stop:700 length:558 start_codon:yes stop_codon:yes gene_type:complete